MHSESELPAAYILVSYNGLENSWNAKQNQFIIVFQVLSQDAYILIKMSFLESIWAKHEGLIRLSTRFSTVLVDYCGAPKFYILDLNALISEIITYESKNRRVIGFLQRSGITRAY